jgi:hypothetical protein
VTIAKNDQGKNVRSIEIDLDNPEQTYLFPSTSNLKRWYNNTKISSLELRLDYLPGIFILTELSVDDSDLGIFNIEYVDRLIELDRKEKHIDWSKPAAVIDRRTLRPVPEQMQEYLKRNSGNLEFDFGHLANSFLAFLSERNQLTLLSNDHYKQVSAFGESEEDFRELCLEHAGTEKSEQAVKLGEFFERLILQNISRLRQENPDDGGRRAELISTGIEDFHLASKSLLAKAINLQLLDYQADQAGLPKDPEAYVSILKAESDRLAGGLEVFKEEYKQLSKQITESFGNLEREVISKASAITTIVVPLAKSSIQLLRISRVWLPYWQAEYREGDTSKNRMIKAF